MCRRYPGFLRAAIADPQPERRWFRRGWVTFERQVNIKEICWNLNNIRVSPARRPWDAAVAGTFDNRWFGSWIYGTAGAVMGWFWDYGSARGPLAAPDGAQPPAIGLFRQ